MADSDTSSLLSAFVDILKWAISSKSWAAIIGTVVVGILGLVVWGVFIFKGRKLARLAHEKAVKEEELKQKEEDAQKEKNEAHRKELEEEIKKLKEEIQKLDKSLVTLDTQLTKTIKEIEGAKGWDELLP